MDVGAVIVGQLGCGVTSAAGVTRVAGGAGTWVNGCRRIPLIMKGDDTRPARPDILYGVTRYHTVCVGGIDRSIQGMVVSVAQRRHIADQGPPGVVDDSTEYVAAPTAPLHASTL